jgi:hypothetical membrane protein
MAKQGNGDTSLVAAKESRTRILSLVALSGVSYFGLVILLLSLLDTEYNPITLPASDYGVGRFAIAMNFGFLIAGIGICAFALANVLQKQRVRSRVGPALLFVAGLALIMNSFFTTNAEGGPATLHGTIHAFGGFIFFTSAPIGVLLISRHVSRTRTITTLVGLIIGFIVLGLPYNASGLAERLILLMIFSSIIVASLSLYTNSKHSKLIETS